MTPQRPQERAHRIALGGELKRLRALSAKSGRMIAPEIGISQSTVSRIENGLGQPPSIDDLRAWAQAIGATPQDTARLEWLLERAVSEYLADPLASEVTPLEPWRASAGLAGIQDEARTAELSARSVANFQPCIVPGLLQTQEYARRVLEIAGPGDVTITEAVALRMERQEILHQPGRRFEFIMTEGALRWRSGPASMLAPQLNRIASVSSLPSVTVGVIPWDADMHAVPTGAFVLYEERDDGQKPMVTAETPHDRIVVYDVQVYREELDLLRRAALFGESAIAFLQDLAGRVG